MSNSIRWCTPTPSLEIWGRQNNCGSEHFYKYCGVLLDLCMCRFLLLTSCTQQDRHLSQPSGGLPRPCLLQLHCGQLPFLHHHLAPQWGWGPGSTSQSDHQHSPGGQQDTGEQPDPPQHHCRGHWHLHLFSIEHWRVGQHDHWTTGLGWVRKFVQVHVYKNAARWSWKWIKPSNQFTAHY